ncbi:MAG: hypothetical protein FJ312_06440 [SAR202 cluster bacterium]|nr:hypothetical protein [SAR202 cluster bacterium]
MNRRVADYPAELTGENLAVSVAAFVLAVSFVLLTYNLVRSWISGPVAEANPWKAKALEWQTSSSSPVENFPVPPVVTGDPHCYGEQGLQHARFPRTAREAGAHAGDGD